MPKLLSKDMPAHRPFGDLSYLVPKEFPVPYLGHEPAPDTQKPAEPKEAS